MNNTNTTFPDGFLAEFSFSVMEAPQTSSSFAAENPASFKVEEGTSSFCADTGCAPASTVFPA